MVDETKSNKKSSKLSLTGYKDSFSFIGQNKLKAFLLFALFWLIFYFLINKFDKYQRVPPVTIAAVLSTIFYLTSFSFISYFYTRLKSNLAEAKEISLSDKLGLGLRIAIALIMAPSFVKILVHITEGNILLLILIIVLFLIPAWVFFSVFIKKMLDSFFLMAILFLGSTIISATLFFDAPFFENISRAYTFLNGFLGFISAVFFPALLISLIFIEIPDLMRRKSFGILNK